MSRYAIVNLMDVKESVSGMADGIEGRFARSLLDSRELGVSHFRYAPSYRSPMAHSHREQEEAYVIIADARRALLDGEVIDLAQWDVLRIAPEVVRTFEAGVSEKAVNQNADEAAPAAPAPIELRHSRSEPTKAARSRTAR